MFLLNVGYKWTNHDRVDGVVINASGVHKAQATRRNLSVTPDCLLFDPQLYLSGLNFDNCNNTCARLSTYPWFGGVSTSLIVKFKLKENGLMTTKHLWHGHILCLL